MPGYKASAEMIMQCGGNIGGMNADAKAVRDKVAGAEVPEVSWGLLGLATTYSSYRDLLEKFKQHLDEMSEGLTKAGEDITACGRDYQESDRSMAEMFGKILGEVGKGSGGGGGGSW
ncbi:WXG100 family type VII secretion target [Saccharopolyspora shandongensis]|uniref:WXG100 family type VII secretion target n=1 Tax=Saccharopolyspora shandongensis TaxID=418495 RepID=UPI0033CC3AE6